MADETEDLDFFDSDIEEYTKKYGTGTEDEADADFIDELFESSDGSPVTDWSMDDVHRLIEEAGDIEDIEEAGDDFDFDKYEKYTEPEQPAFGKSEKADEDDSAVFEEGAVYFSEEYAKDLASKKAEENKTPTVFEDVSSFSEEEDGESSAFVFEESGEDDFFFEDEGEDLSAVEGHVNQARPDGEFREIDESVDENGFEQTEEDVVYDGTFDRGDYLKIKDIFKSSKILSKRRAARAEVRETAYESVKEQYGEAIFDAKKREGDFNEILRRQKSVEREEEKRKEEEEKRKEAEKTRRFDVDSENYVVTRKPQEETLEIQEDEDFDDTIFISDLAHFEEVARDSKAAHTDDFSGTKIIGEETAEKQQSTRDIFISPRTYRQSDDQISFEGFETEEDGYEPERVSEEDVQENLRRTREEKKSRFRMTNLPDDYDDTDPNYFSPEKGRYDEEEYIVLSDENNPSSPMTAFRKSFIQEKNKRFTEYTSPNEKPQIFKELADKRRRSVFGLIAMALLSVVFLAVNLVVNVFEALPVDAAAATTASLSIVVLLATFVFGSSVTQNGIEGMRKKNFGFDSAVTCLILAGIVVSASMFFDLSELGETLPVYTASETFLVILCCFGRAVESARATNALKTATVKRRDNLYTIQSIDDERTAQNIGRILAGENPDLKYSCKTAFPQGFVHNSFSQNPADRQVRVFFPIAAALSLVIGIITGIIYKDIPMGAATFLACLLVSFPLPLMPALNISLYSLNRKLSRKNACIVGYTSARNIEKTNAVVIDSTDLFDIEKCNFHGMKDYGTVRVDDIILYAAAMLTNSKGPLSHVFDKAILGDKSELLPEVGNLCYEERLGLSGWINGEKVLIGNRNLLINHNLEAPPKGPEIACLKEGKKIFYIAIDGTVAAMLVVEYAKNEEMKKHLSRLDKHGITTVVTTNDCNIDEEFLSMLFNMPRESFKVVGDYEGGLLDGYINRERATAPAKLIHDGTSESFFETFSSAIAYSSSIKISLAVQTVMMFLALIVTAIFAFSGKISLISGGIIILIEILSTLVMSLIAIIRNKF